MASIINSTTTAGVTVTGDNSGSLQLATNNGTTAVTIDTSQRVAFVAGTAALPAITTTGDTNTGIFFPAADTIAFTEGGVESMRIDSSGNLLIGRTSQFGFEKVGITYAGNSNWGLGLNDTFSNASANSAIQFNKNGSNVGSITTSNSATAYVTSSDYRLKENIAPIIGALAKVAALKPVTYDWKIGGSSQGFIAHELQEIVPDCVFGEKDAVEIVDDVDADGKVIGTKEVPKYQGIDTSFLVATLTAAIQELNAKVEAQAVRIAELEGAK
jgi:hypothetical protein